MANKEQLHRKIMLLSLEELLEVERYIDELLQKNAAK